MITSILPTYNRAPMTFVSGEGAWLTTGDGRRMLDMGAGIAVNALGHANPELVATLTAQAQKLWHVSNLYQIPEQQKLADLLVEKTFADTVFFTNSGTETCELAVKMARKYWYDAGHPERTTIITFHGSFHGRSSAGIAAAGSDGMVKGFGPILPGFVQVPFGDLDAVKGALKAGDVAAVLIEPIQGEGGIKPAPDGFLQALRAACDETGTLLALDEVQTGVGRTGKLFAHELFGITPDIMMVAKGIGGGFPLGAVLATEAAASGMTAGTHGSTYGGNPLGCAIGVKVLETVSDEAFLGQVSQRAGQLRQGLESLVARYDDVFETVRGAGLMLGVVCRTLNVDVVKAGYDAGLIVIPAAENVVRFLPPLNLTEDDINQAFERLELAAQSVRAAQQG